MEENILVFIPSKFDTNRSGFIEGFYKRYPNLKAYYITNETVLTQCKNYIGYTGRFLTNELFGENLVFIEHGTKNIHINSQGSREQFITEIYYDLEGFKSSDVVYGDEGGPYGVHIKELAHRLNDCGGRENSRENEGSVFSPLLANTVVVVDFMLQVFSKVNSVLKNCATFSHSENSMNTAKWFLKILEQDRKCSLKIGHVIFAKLVDLILGIVLIYFCFKYEDVIVTKFKYVLKDFVTQLRQLLIYLMGSPIGLKLNYAFNHSLGRFFFYHINLWRVFLEALQPLLEGYFKILLVPALLGASYQIAVVCDIISLATFHVYCIYVYAARLFSLQIKGLTSLWRLFIGRKLNPLRLRIDSCEYSSNQLFIGTLGFTVLLFLLPTTSMYYAVFATFRLVILITYTFLAKIKDTLNNIPLYISVLWIFRSPSLAGSLQIEWKCSSENTTHIEAKLTPLGLTESLQRFSSGSSSSSTDNHSLGKIIQHLFTGQLV